MTAEEAIEILEGLAVPVNAEVAFDMAIEALERQIPEETILRPAGLLGNIPTYTNHCPECNYEIFMEKYCPHCGQAIYWSED